MPSKSLLLAGAALLLVVGVAGAGPAPAAKAEVGQPAPDFTLTDLQGKSVTLSQFKGKRVVLEWFNPECPFVVYAHTKGPLKELGKKYTAQGVVWLAINSGAPGKQGAGKDKNVAKAKEYGMDYPVLLDESGTVGQSYGARTTPHMYVIDEKGVLVYRGGLDNAPLGEPEGGKLVSHVENALGDLAAGRRVATPDTKPYGCSVKYGG
ncbi:MAG: thioredoxin family protein [Myxococcota bacterium]